MKQRLLVRLPMLLFCLLTASAVMAQKKAVTGKVADAHGTPLQGVTVLPKNSSHGVVTAADGSFRILIDPSTRILLFSSIGYVSREVPVTDGPLQVELVPGNAAMNEVIVVGYGTARKKEITGSIATVGEKEFQKGSITTPEQLIAGKVPGVSIISNGGQPGSGSTIRIRGGSSLNASNDPLIVIDGVPMESEIPTGQKSTIAGASNPLSFINPNDIESFTVLKDASAAIYGTRAANGVILITTKKGRPGGLRVSASTVSSMSALTKKVSVLSPAQFRDVVNNSGSSAQIAMLGSASTDWQNEIYQNAYGINNNISISGGIKKLPYRISVGYQDQNGILRTDNLKKLSAALVVNPVFLDNHLKIDLNLKASRENTRFANQAAIGGAVSFDPTQPVSVKSPRFGGYYEWLDPSTATGLTNLAGRNPVGLLYQHFDEAHPERMIGNLQVDYKFHFLPDLHANVNLGYDLAEGKGRTFIPDSAAESYVAGGAGGSNNPYKTTKNNSLFEFYFNYTKDLKAIRSRVEAIAGYSYNDYQTKIYNYATYNADGVKYPNTDPAYPFDKPRHTLLSYFGRLKYSYDDRYYLTAILRRDGSSRFSPNNRWGLFPSLSLAWNVKDESFLRAGNAVSDLKLRVSYGVTGQQDGIGNYDYLSYYSLSSTNASYQFGGVYYQGFRPGGFYANRKWEQTGTWNAGVDYGFLDNRITGAIDFYVKKTSNLLNSVPQPAGSNFSAYIVANVGDMENKGVEFSVNAQPVKTKDFNWDFGFNVTYNKNRITNLTVVPNDTSYVGFASGSIAGGIGGQFVLINAVGDAKNTFYLYRQVYDNKGAPLEGVFVDKNGDGIINQKDLYKSKPADPKVFLGFSTNVSYRKWSAGLVMRASIGNYAYNNNYSQTGVLNQVLGNSVLYNASGNYLVTKFKGGNAQELLSDYYIQNASFLRMDNLNIGYNLGGIPHTRLDCRLNASIQNVFVITKYKGLDPEISAGTGNNPGIDNSLYPRPRVYSLGLQLDFH